MPFVFPYKLYNYSLSSSMCAYIHSQTNFRSFLRVYHIPQLWREQTSLKQWVFQSTNSVLSSTYILSSVSLKSVLNFSGERSCITFFLDLLLCIWLFWNHNDEKILIKICFQFVYCWCDKTYFYIWPYMQRFYFAII